MCEAKDLKLLGDTRIKRSSEGAERKGQQKTSSSTVREPTASSEAFLCNYIRMCEFCEGHNQTNSKMKRSILVK